MILTLALGMALPSGPWTEPSREAPPDSDWPTAVVAPGPAARSPTRRSGKYRRIIKVLRTPAPDPPVSPAEPPKRIYRNLYIQRRPSPARARPPTTSVDAAPRPMSE